MSRSFSNFIAWRYLWTKRSEAFITIITISSIVGVALGVAVLNVVMAIMSGFEFELRQKIIGTNSHVVVRRLGDYLNDWQDKSSRIAELPGVNGVSPFTYSQALIRSGERVSGLLIRGILEDSRSAEVLTGFVGDSTTVSSAKKSMPKLLQPRETKATNGVALPAIVIGKELSKAMQIFEGDVITLLSPRVGSSPFGVVPRFKRFVVSEVYESGLVEYEMGLAYMSLEQAQVFFEMGDSVSGIEVYIDDPFQAQQTGNLIETEILSFDPGHYAEDWTQSNRALWEALALEKRVYFLVLLLLVVLASFSIVSSLVMLVLEKRKDIAVLRTLGASSKSIRSVFFFQGTVIGGMGTISGLVLGYALCAALQVYGFPLPEGIFPVKTVPVRVDLMNFSLVALCSFVICSLATLYPAYKASLLKPAEVLRYG